MTTIGDQYGVLPLRGKAAVFGDHSPVILKQSGLFVAGIDHGLDGEGHARFYCQPGARGAVVQNLRVFMEHPADAVTAVFAHHGEAVAFGMLLNHVPNITKLRAGLDQFNAFVHTFKTDCAQPLRPNRGFANIEHATGVAMKLILDHGNVNIDNIPVFQDFVGRMPWQIT